MLSEATIDISFVAWLKSQQKREIRNLHPRTLHLQLRGYLAQADASAAEIEARKSDGVGVCGLEDFLEGAKAFLAMACCAAAMG